MSFIPKKSPLRLLHLLSQRPGLTGSGVYLRELVSRAHLADIEQMAIVGVPAKEEPSILPLTSANIRTVRFETEKMPFPVAGMSDVMPYRSTRFSEFSTTMLKQYLSAFSYELNQAVRDFQPHLVHSHHLWLATASAASTLDIPVVTSCHGTGLRQMELALHLAPRVIAGCRKVERVLALTDKMIVDIVEKLSIDRSKITTTGAGYDEKLFYPPSDTRCESARRASELLGQNIPSTGVRIAYAGKLSNAKGVPELLDAVSLLIKNNVPEFTLLLAGAGTGAEADAVRARAANLKHHVKLLGQLNHEALSAVFRCSDVFVLPSYYEGLPLVVIEALASGCRLVITDLPNVREMLPNTKSPTVEWIPVPNMATIDKPRKDAIPKFVESLTLALCAQIERSTHSDSSKQHSLARTAQKQASPYTWDQVFKRIAKIYEDVAR